MKAKENKLDFIKNQNFLYGVGWDFYENITRLKKVIEEYSWDYDFYIEFLRSSEDWEEYIVCDYYDNNLNTVIIIDEEVYWEFEDENDVLNYLELLNKKCNNMKAKTQNIIK